MAGGKIGDEGRDAGAKKARGFTEDCGLPVVLLLAKVVGPWRVHMGERDVWIENVRTKKVAWRDSKKHGVLVADGLADRFNAYEIAREFPPQRMDIEWHHGLSVSPLVSPPPRPGPAEPSTVPLDLDWKPRKK